MPVFYELDFLSVNIDGLLDLSHKNYCDKFIVNLLFNQLFCVVLLV